MSTPNTFSFLSVQDIAELSSLLSDNKALVILPSSDDQAAQGGSQQLGVVDLDAYKTWLTADVNSRIDALIVSGGGSTFPAPITLTLTGPVTGSVSFDGSADVGWTSSIAAGALSIAMVNGLATALSDLEDGSSIAEGAISLAQLAPIAAHSLLGNLSASTATPAPLAASDVRVMLSLDHVENTALSSYLGFDSRYWRSNATGLSATDGSSIPGTFFTDPTRMAFTAVATASAGYPSTDGAVWSFVYGGANASDQHVRSFDLFLDATVTSKANLYARSYNTSGVPVAWNRFLTTADTGSGNGLDADTLDGHSGDYYLDLANVTNTLNVGQGGTGATSLTGLLKGNGGIDPLSTAVPGTDYVVPSGSITGNAGTATKFAAAVNIALDGGVTGNATAFDGSGSISIHVTAVALSAATGVLTTSHGGTGLSTFTSGSYFIATSSSAMGQQTPAQVLSNIGALAASSYTASDVLSKLLTVDGSGSNLDADKLDGQEGTYYTDFSHATNLPTTLSGYGIADAYTKSQADTRYSAARLGLSIDASAPGGFWTSPAGLGFTALTNTSSNYPVSAGGAVWSFVATDVDAAASYESAFDIFKGMDDNHLYWRSYNASADGGSWVQLYDSSNLDMSLYFLKSGGTVSGNVIISGTTTLNNDLIINGDVTLAGDMIPDESNTRSLGSLDFPWKEVYVGPGSLYVNGQEVLSTAPGGDVIISADVGQNISIQPLGAADLVLYPQGTGGVQVKGTLVMNSGFKVISSDGNAIVFGDDLTFGAGRGITNGLLIDGHAAWHAGNFNPSLYLTTSGNAATATSLASAQAFSFSGAVTAAAQTFNGTAGVQFNVTALDLTKGTGTLTVAQGGTGVATLSGLIKGNGANAFSAAVAGTDYIAPNSSASLTQLVVSRDPVSAFEVATKQYVDSQTAGLVPKIAVAVATTANITLSGLQTIDGYLTLDAARVLVKNQTQAADNGIYIAAAGAWTRAADANTWAELEGAFTFVENGDTQEWTGWVASINDGGTLGTTAVSFVQFSGSGSLSQGVGIVISGNQVSLAPSGVTGGTYTKLTVDVYGRATAGGSLIAADIPNLSTAILTSGVLGVARGGTGAGTLTGLVKGNGASAMTAAVAGTDYVLPSGSITGNAATATKLATARTINGVAFDGTGNITITATAANALTIGAGLSGGVYNGSGAVTIALGTPGSLGNGSTNTVTSGSHTHALALVASDIPSLDASIITTGALTPARGGTGIGSYTTGYYLNAFSGTQLQERSPAQVLADIGALASTSYTANDVLTKIKTVDGAGSGLDSDLLDGQQGTYYLSLTNASGTLAVAHGGTGAVTLTGMLKGNGTGAFSAAVAGLDYVIPAGNITGSAGSATKWSAPISLTLTGDVTGSVSFDGSSNVSLATVYSAFTVEDMANASFASYDAITHAGMYHDDDVTGYPGAPFGQLLVVNGGSNTTVGQLYFDGVTSGHMWMRTGNPLSGGGAWGSWGKVLTNKDLDPTTGAGASGFSWNIYGNGSVVLNKVGIPQLPWATDAHYTEWDLFQLSDLTGAVTTGYGQQPSGTYQPVLTLQGDNASANTVQHTTQLTVDSDGTGAMFVRRSTLPNTTPGAVILTWAALRIVSVNGLVKPSTATGYYYQATTAGSSGTSEPSWPTIVGGTVTDGGVTWKAIYPWTAWYQVADAFNDFQAYGDWTLNGATTFGSTVTLHADPVSAMQAVTKQYADNTFVSMAATNLGKVGSVPYNNSSTTAAAWAAFPVGYSVLMSGAAITTANGAPSGSWGYFQKIANRDSLNGWGGLWIDNATAVGSTYGLYIGGSPDNTTTPTWSRVWTDATDGAGSGLDADLLDGQQGAYYLAIANLTGTLTVAKGGTGVATLTGLVKGNGTSAFSAAVAGTDYVVPSGSITGNAGTATKLATARTIALSGSATGTATAFDGSGDISIPITSIDLTTTTGTLAAVHGGTGLSAFTAGNYVNAASATTLQQRTPAQVLADIGALAAASYTASDVLAKLKTVDGTGSGLDADLLDGHDSTYYAQDSTVVHLATAGETLTGAKFVQGAWVYSSAGTYTSGYWNDNAALLGLSAGTNTGTIVFKTSIPSTAALMFRAVFDGYQYGSPAGPNGHYTYDVSGYFYATSQTVLYLAYDQKGLVTQQVRAGITDDGFWCLMLGTDASTWTQTSLRAKLMLRYQAAASTYIVGNTLSLVADTTAYTSVVATATPIKVLPWAQLAGTPSTLAGYGITDAYSKLPASIGSSVDLNTYLTAGYYAQSTNASAASGSNYPTPYAGLLEVYVASATMLWHRYTTYGTQSNGSTVYERGYYGGTWGSWYQLARTVDNVASATKLASPVNINGTPFDGSSSITIVATATNPLTIGNGLTGVSYNGGSAITVALGTPGTLGNGSANAATSGSHTHALSLVVSDIPSLPASIITSGSLAVAHGGTGTATLTGLIMGNGTAAFTAAVAGTDYLAPNTDISVTSVTLAGDPISPFQAATKQYVDNAVQGLSPKDSVMVATTTNITLSGLQTVDGYTTLEGDRVLVKNQTTTSDNGFYIASAGTWLRSPDGDIWTELAGAFVFVVNGTTQATTGWVCTAVEGGILGTTAVSFTQFSSQSTYTQGAGISIVGNQISLAMSGVSAGTYPKVTVDVYGRVTGGASLVAGDLPSHSTTLLTSGTLGVARGGTGIASYTTGSYINAASGTVLQQRTPAQVLSDIGGLASSSYTAADVLTKLLTVDGAGSSLDADLLDGQQGSYYLSYANATGLPTTLAGYGITDALPQALTALGTSVDLNTIVANGRYVQGTSANATMANNYPAAYAGTLEVLANVSGNEVWQRYVLLGSNLSVSGGGSVEFLRGCYNGTWSAWVQTARTTDNVATATQLATARTIGVSGVTGTAQSFDGSANIVIPVTAVPATLLTGTIAAARLPTLVAHSLMGNSTASTTTPSAITLGAGLAFSGTTLTATNTGTVTGLSIATANGISGTVATASTTPVITLTLGAITPSSVSIGGTDILGGHVLYIASGNTYLGGQLEIDVDADTSYALTLANSTGANAFSLGMGATADDDLNAYLVNQVSGGGIALYVNGTLGTPGALLDASANLSVVGSLSASNFSGSSSGTNTGDQTTITGNAGTATKLATARTINGVAFDGTGNISITASVGTLTFGNGLTTGTYTGAATTIAMGVGGTVSGSSTNAVTATSHTHALTLASADITGALGYIPVQQGTGVGQLGNVVKFGWKTGSKLGLTVDTTDIGNVAIESWAAGNFLALIGGPVTGPVSITTGTSTTGLTVTTTGASTTLSIVDTGTNGANLRLMGNGATTPNKSIRAQNGTLQFINSAYSAVVTTMDDAGNWNISGSVAITGNVSFGSVTASSATDLTKHIALYGSTYGFSITSNTLNYVSGGGIHNFVSSAGAAGTINVGTINLGIGTLTTGGGETHWATTLDDYYMFQNVNNAGFYSASNGYLIQFNKAANSTTAFGPLSSNTRIFTGYDSGTAGSVSCSAWFRSNGATGWYNSTYAGGVYMTDTTYVRAYNGTKMAAADFVIVSDEREKAGIRPFEFKGRLVPKSFSMKKDGTADFGFIAQEVMVDYPEAVGYIEESDRFQLSYGKLTAIISYQVNRLEDVVDQQKRQIDTLNGELMELRTMVEQLLATRV